MALRQSGEESVILEKSNTFGGLCGNFDINGFRFDRFVHLSFSNIEKANSVILKTRYIKHIPNPANLYNRIWIKHPAQNNLYPLPHEEKQRIIHDFKNRRPIDAIGNQTEMTYEDWLRYQFGDYFAEHFPMAYTRKYWMKEARDLRTEWIGNRIYRPSIDEVIAGCEHEQTAITYYAKEMRYPATGGFSSFFQSLADEADIRYNIEIVSIDPKTKTVTDSMGCTYPYKRLISSVPLPEVIGMIDDVPDSVRNAIGKLECTSGYHVSIALKSKNIPPYIWWYIYDDDILASRVYSPSLKSPDNAPAGCSSLQMEIYCNEGAYTIQQLLNGTVRKLVESKIIDEKDIMFTHIEFEKYANVIFSNSIYESRKIVRDYLSSLTIDTIGRFGEWDYLWSDQSLMSGINIYKN